MFDWLNAGISHGYITATNCADCPHYAVDVATKFHTPVTALLSGTVVSQRTGLPWGTEVFIKPDNGEPQYYYYHLDTLNTQPGQHVNSGDIIGLSGGQNVGGANPSSPTMSSGPHTHVGFFTSFTDTQLGSRPFGPDITPLIQSLQNGGQPPSSVSSVPAPPIAGTSFFTQIGQKIGLFLVGIIFLFLGFYLLFEKQVKAGMQKTADTAKKALEVAAL